MNQNNKPGPNNNQPQPNRWANMFNVFMVLFLIIFAINTLISTRPNTLKTEISYNAFMELVDRGYVQVVELNDTTISLTIKENVPAKSVLEVVDPNGRSTIESIANLQFVTGRIDNYDIVSYLDGKHLEGKVGDFKRPLANNQGTYMQILASWVVPVIALYLLYLFFFRSMAKRMGSDNSGMGFMGSVGKSRAKVYNVEKNVGVSFKDVAGQDEAKESLIEIVDYLHNPEKYHKVGAKQPKGALLVGPPGTGKTLMARALAGEAKVPFYHLTGSEFVELYVGVGASRVRDLFQTASKDAPCIIFIDEIDAIGKSRDNSLGSNDEREQTLNQLLAEMDGFDASKGVVVLAATNRPEVLDKALSRAGRFDRRIIVEKPDLPGRESILSVHASKVKIAKEVVLRDIALATSGATGADLANMINEAALRAVRLGRDEVIQEDLMEAVEVVIAGKEKKDRILNSKEKQLVAYHEVGHALVSALQKNSQPIQKITIVPRTMGSLGYTMSVPEEDRYLMTKDELLSQITTLLGGRAAELVQFSTITTGAANDIERATSIARSIVTIYGMSEKFGPMGLESTVSQYLDGRRVLMCSEVTGSEIDGEVRAILDACQAETIELLTKNKKRLDAISEFLLQRENITGDEFMELLNNTEEG
ncbi:MAG: ATP-dependent zinc metalloprotease FtsH [Eubacteriaceae bacterium]|nr:ATP-dependent zinc metalloprotease FtsH [Eubacteriaceae bacterium]